MKKFFFAVAALVLPCVLVSNTFAADREHTLKVYNWADYIDMNVLNGFPAWYYEQTGEQVEVLYQTFDINESMLTEIEVGQEDYDVICPSEYIIERMLRNGLLQPINKDFGQTPDYTKLVSPFAVDKFQQMAPDSSVCVADYTVGYMWGTTGILYNTALVDKSEILSLGGLQNPEFAGKVFMKDAFRDIYSVVVLYAYRDEIARGEVTRDELVANVTDERIQRVEEFLTSMKNNIAGWEVDFGKEEMTKGKAWLNLSWSGDAQFAIEEAAEMGVMLDYIVPQEGSNVWFDGWVIPKYAKNTKAAAYFINYMCRADNALANMEEIGYVSCAGGKGAAATILEVQYDAEAWPNTVDATYFFGDEPIEVDGELLDPHALHLNPVYYADKSIIDRCALMHDAGEAQELLLEMWNEIKLAR